MAKDLLTLDLSAMFQQTQQMSSEIAQRLDVAARELSIQCEAHIKELSSERLHSRLDEYNKNLSWEELDKGVYAVVLNEKALWIEAGTEPLQPLSDARFCGVGCLIGEDHGLRPWTRFWRYWRRLRCL